MRGDHALCDWQAGLLRIAARTMTGETPMTASPADDLHTIRDLVRWGLSRFNKAGLAFGHGTSSAESDIAFLVLESLSLPIDSLDNWLDSRLTREERERIVGLIDQRVLTRKPTPYLVNRAYIQGMPFYIDERVIVPRSFIAEILVGAFTEEETSPLGTPASVAAVADICTGSGCLAILASAVFPQAEVDAVDLSPDALAVAAINVEEHGAERVSLHQGDLYDPLGDRRYDLIISNPPYVDEETMEALPEEYRAEPAMALAGGFDGLDLVRRLIDGAADHLNPGGGLLCEIGSGREILAMDYPHLPFVWLDTEESDGEVFWLSAESLGVTA